MIQLYFERRAKELGGGRGLRFCVEARDQSAQATCARRGIRDGTSAGTAARAMSLPAEITRSFRDGHYCSLEVETP